MAISIYSWLKSGRDYETGIGLYEQMGGSELLLGIFRKGKNSFTEKKLAEELSKLSAPPQAMAQQFVAPPQQRAKTTTQPSVKFSSSTSGVPTDAVENISPKPEEGFEEFPIEIRDAIAKQKELYRKRDHLKAALLPHIAIELRREYCLKIMEYTYKIDEYWKVRDCYAQTGEIMYLEKEEKQNDISLFVVENDIKNCRSRISKAKRVKDDEKLAKEQQTMDELMGIKSKLLEDVVQ